MAPPAAPVTFPRRHHGSLQELASRVLDSRGVAGANEVIARDLLGGFYEVCMRAGLDGVLEALAQAFSIEIVDGSSLAEEPKLQADLATRLGNKAEFDPRGPRNIKPKQLADCLLASLSLTLFDPPARTITLSDELRVEFGKALTGVIDVELAVPQIRDAIVAGGRARCEERYWKAFDKLAAELDERGMRIGRQLKLPIDAVQAVQRALFDARAAVLERAAQVAIDRAVAVLAAASPEAAERIGQPITDRLTPRDVAVQRVSDARASKAPDAVARSLFDSLTELAELAWTPLEQIARPYSINQTYAVGDVIDHPKLGRGTVTAIATQRIDVDFPGGANTLVHARVVK